MAPQPFVEVDMHGFAIHGDACAAILRDTPDVTLGFRGFDQGVQESRGPVERARGDPDIQRAPLLQR